MDRALFERLAVPRLVGTPDHAHVRALLEAALAQRGFTVQQHVFDAVPSRWLRDAPRTQGANLVGTRPGVRVAVWLAAHYDSKGQPLSMAARLAAFPFSLLHNRVRNDSPGAVDNASGLVTVLAVADALGATAPIGLLFLDAEEMGLAGARALVRERPDLLRGRAVINCDGIDDVGRPIVLVHRAGPLGRAVAAAVGGRALRLLPVVVDGQALAVEAGECVSILQGDWGTMRVVHTPRDIASRVALTGAQRVAAGLVRALVDAVPPGP